MSYYVMVKPCESVVQFTEALVKIPSISPDDGHCQSLICEFLEPLGFRIIPLHHGKVSNFWAERIVHPDAPLFCFAGHTDVVPPGPESQWASAPFSPSIRDGYLFGRGTADMKGSLAAMLLASKQFLSQHPNTPANLGFIITSGEDGDHFADGTPKIMEYLHQQGIKPQWCVVGEPSSETQVGDMVRIGRRGSLTAKLRILGKQGHVAYPHLAKNPIHLAGPFISKLSQHHWDDASAHFPATSLQITHIESAEGASNVIPAHTDLQFNFRYSNQVTHIELQQIVADLLKQHALDFDISWQLNGEPFLTPQGPLISAVESAINQHTQIKTKLSTGGGTSDGRFIAPYGIEVIELGPVNATIHQANECVRCEDLVILQQLYYQILLNLFTGV